MPNTDTSHLIALLDSAFNRRSWHGPNLRGAIRGVTLAGASWRLASGRHNIWELVVHSAYWKYAGLRRLTGGKRGSFPLEGSNWFERPQHVSLAAWRADLKLLEDAHRALRQAVSRLNAARSGAQAEGQSVQQPRARRRPRGARPLSCGTDSAAEAPLAGFRTMTSC